MIMAFGICCQISETLYRFISSGKIQEAFSPAPSRTFTLSLSHSLGNRWYSCCLICCWCELPFPPVLQLQLHLSEPCPQQVFLEASWLVQIVMDMPLCLAGKQTSEGYAGSLRHVTFYTGVSSGHIQPSRSSLSVQQSVTYLRCLTLDFETGFMLGNFAQLQVSVSGLRTIKVGQTKRGAQQVEELNTVSTSLFSSQQWAYWGMTHLSQGASKHRYLGIRQYTGDTDVIPWRDGIRWV